VFERFDERARQVVVLAQDEARLLKHNYIGTEHILLGLLREAEGLAARVLESLGVTLDDVRLQVARIIGEGEEVATAGQIPFTPRSKKVLELALREALSLGHDYIGTEHILLGVVREGEGVAATILAGFGVGGEAVSNAVVAALSGSGPEAWEYEPKSPPLASEVIEEVRRVADEKRTAVEEQNFPRAAELEDRRRRILRAARALERAWSDEPAVPEGMMGQGEHGTVSFGSAARARRMPRRTAHYGLNPTSSPATLVLGWFLFGTALGIGILVGWAIWG
jgi:ATP-dependent Clp protease ATP-binding subunit ClpA